MEYRTALVFLFLYYIRPQDWIPAIVGFNIIRPMIVVWLVSIFAARTRPAISGFLRTPHDWALLVYFFYVVWNSPDSNGTFKSFMPYIVFYAFTVRSLSSWDRVLGYLKFWNLMLLGVSALAVASLFGVDLTGAKDVTNLFLGRLCIGTWLHDNPNALAHSVVVVLPLSYVLYFWSKGVGNRIIIFPLCVALAGYCVYETKSKGAFLVGGALTVLIFVVGRPKFVQIMALALAATLGVSALSFLPRMDKMGSLSSDQGVQGRLMIWEMARRVTETKPGGEGWKQFKGEITWMGEQEWKATHSSYVQVGADLGINGLFFYLLPLWAAVRSLLIGAKFTKDNPDRERCRRANLLLIIGYAMSGWMINREYHTEYFLLIAVAAAMHRLNLAEKRQLAPVEESVSSEISTAPVPTLSLEPAAVTLTADLESGKKFWNRFTLVDLGVGVAMTWAVLFTWDYVLSHM